MPASSAVRLIQHDSHLLSLHWGDCVQEFRWLGAGRFTALDGRPVTLTTGTWLATTTVTRAWWMALGGVPVPDDDQGPQHPVVQVSWFAAIAICDQLTTLLDGHGQVSLPSEARWEQAWAAGDQGDAPHPIDEYCWHAGNSRGGPRPVATRRANQAGFHDLLGNVWEWCADWSGPRTQDPVVDPLGPPEGLKRVVRGGSWSIPRDLCQASRRGGDPPQAEISNVGFRWCLVLA